MKTNIRNRNQEAGSTLVVTVVLCAILCIIIAGYLTFARQQNFLSMRSQTWNTAIAVSEAGIEEGLEHLNYNFENLASQGWVGSPPNYILLPGGAMRTLPSGDRYLVWIIMTNPIVPRIRSIAQVYTPTFASLANAPMFAAGGVPVVVPPITRTVEVTASRSKLFAYALTAKKQIDLNGNNIRTDSFDSTDPAKSTNGQYDPAKFGDHGDIASNDTIQNTINVGNANIYGRVSTGPQGTVSVGAEGRVGPIGWTPSGSDKIYPGWFTDDMNFTFPEPEVPDGNVFTPGGGYITNILTGVSNLTVSTFPSPAPAGVVTTNSFTVTSNTYPSPVPPGGITSTNTIVQYTTSPTYPASGTYQSAVITNTVATTSTAYPGANTYLGGVTTNTVAVKNSPTAPEDGTYLGALKITGSGSGTKYTYDLITGYTCNLITGYSCWLITGHSYTYTIASYTYAITVTNLVTVTYYDYILKDIGTNNYYQLGSLDSGKKVYVEGNTALDVTGNVDLSSASVTIGPSGAIQMYIHSNFSLSGNNILNQPGYAKNFIIWADENVTSLTYSGNAGFNGCVYAPWVNLALNGSGSTTIDINGAFVINSATLNGHFNFHYDESLANILGGRFIIRSWDEL